MNHLSIDTVVQSIHQKWGSRILQPANWLHNAQDFLPTSWSELDDSISGLPYRQITHLMSRPTSGSMTFLLYVIAFAQKANKRVVLLDAGTSFDGGYASQCGVVIQEMILVEVKDESLSLEVLRDVIRSRLVELLIVNLMGLSSIELDWRRILPTLRDSPCVVIVLTRPQLQLPVANLRLLLNRQHWVRQDDDVVGCVSKITVDHNQFGRVGRSVLLSIPFVKGYWDDLHSGA